MLMEYLMNLLIQIFGAFFLLIFSYISLTQIILHINQKNFLGEKSNLLKNYYLASLHSHSYYDGELKPKEIILGAYKNKYTFYSITDHLEPKLFINPNLPFDYLESLIKKGEKLSSLNLKKLNYYTIKIYNKKNPKAHVLYLLKGVEISAINKNQKIHLGVVGLNKMPKAYQNLDYYFKKYQKENVLIIACHPFSPNQRGMGFCNLKKYSHQLDFVELNGSFPLPFGYIINSKTKKIANNLQIPVIANTDSHIKSNYFNTFSSLIPKSKDFDENDIIGYIKKHRKSTKTVMCYPPIMKIYIWILKGLFFKKKVPKEFKTKIKK